MGKLFISLYVYIIASLFIASGVIEQLWPYDESEQHVLLDNEFGQSLWLLSQTSDGLEQLKHNFDSQVIAQQDLVLPPEQQTQLAQNNYLYLYDKQQRIVWYVTLNNSQLLQVGPVGVKAKNTGTVIPYLLVLFIISLPIGLWSLLLWRDFAKLSQACEAVGGAQDFQLSDSSKSFFLPITDTLKVMQQRIEFLLSAQQELTSSVSHEFRTPLARLKFAIAMLENKVQDGKAQHYLSDMQMDIHELESLVSEMLEYARLDTQQPSLQLVPCDIVALIKANIEKVTFDTPIKLTTTLPSQFINVCDSHFMSRVLQNLISNALKHATQNVHISLTANAEKLFLVIEDDGPGIADAEREKVFKPFTRLDKSRDKKTGGFGLGLAIVNKIISWHKGQCKIEDSPLGGVKFIITLEN